jgi:hypothetical protein
MKAEAAAPGRRKVIHGLEDSEDEDQPLVPQQVCLVLRSACLLLHHMQRQLQHSHCNIDVGWCAETVSQDI